MLTAAGVLLIAFVVWISRAANPLLHLSVILDRNRAAAYLSIMLAAVSMFALFLFVTYFLQTGLHYTPIQTGLSFLPMVGMLVVAAQLGTNLLVPRFGPKVLVPIGMLIGAAGMIWLTNLNLHSTYVPDVMLPLMVIGFAMGTIMPASMQTATLGVERQYAGVASALVNTSQQVGGSIGTALLNTLAASAVTAYIADHAPATPTVLADAASSQLRARLLGGSGNLRRWRRDVGTGVPSPRPGRLAQQRARPDHRTHPGAVGTGRRALAPTPSREGRPVALSTQLKGPRGAPHVCAGRV